MPTVRGKFRRCLLGGAVADVIGAVVEAESPGYIAATYRSVDDVLAVKSVDELTGPPWQVGRFTDDTQMTLCVAEWLAAGEAPSAAHLLARFSEAYEPWRRYGPATEAILRLYPSHKSEWRTLATAAFPQGSHGNGSAMRVAPVGLVYRDNLEKAASVAIESSRPTHSHTLAYQGAVLQCLAVATATTSDSIDPAAFLRVLRGGLSIFAERMQDTSVFSGAIDAIQRGLGRDASCSAMSETLGTGITAQESVPMSLYCFLRHRDSYADVVREAVFIGGDTDTIASMAGAISGAMLGVSAIPLAWRDAIREAHYSAAAIEELADRLSATFGG